ncbi:MAG: enoyl-CoA hydratase [Paracoccaceae bacterium]
MPDPILLREDDGAISTLTLNAPEKLNALSDAMLAALKSALEDIAAERSLRAVILRGTGKAFCAGHDLREMTAARQSEDGGKAYFHDLFVRCSDVMTSIVRLPQPVIAQVHGIATAAGCQLVASCDMAVAADDTRFGVNGVDIGLFCSTPMVALSRNVPRKRAFEMLTTGGFIAADEARRLGLVNRVVPRSELHAETRSLAETVASKLSRAVKIGKESFYRQLELPLDQAYAFVGDVMVENMMYEETAEAISAFLEKRAPRWEQ